MMSLFCLRCFSSSFLIDVINVRANAAVVPGYADVRASTAMTDDNNDDGDDGNFDDTLSEILSISSRVATSPDFPCVLLCVVQIFKFLI